MAEKNSYIVVVLGDFNAKLNSWYANDNANKKGSKIEILTASFGFNQITNEPTCILNNSPSCINLIFTSEPNLVTESSVYLSLHANFYHQTTYIKFNLDVIYPLPYGCGIEVWHYKLANSNYIQRAIANFHWEKEFHNVDVSKQVMVFNENVLNIIRNFIPHKTVTFDDSDPARITSRIKTMTSDKSLNFKHFVNKEGFVNNSSNAEKFISLQKFLQSYLILISVRKSSALF